MEEALSSGAVSSCRGSISNAVHGYELGWWSEENGGGETGGRGTHYETERDEAGRVPVRGVEDK